MSSPVQDLVAKAVSNAAFRAQCRKDPRAALQSVGMPVPVGVAVTVYENGPSTIHVVLPQKGDVSALTAVAPYAAKVFEKAWADSAFKVRLLSDPKQAIKEATGATVPARLQIVAHENTDKEMSFVLPYVPASSELSDADLEMVAGGKGDPGAGSCGQALATEGAIVAAGGGIAAAGLGPVSAGAAFVAMGGIFSSFITMAVSASK